MIMLQKTTEFARQELNKYLNMMTGEIGNIALEAGEDSDIFRERCEISVFSGVGSLRANCPRALLLGVYAFLRECGCRFLRPGEKGELIPRKNISEITVSCVFEPSSRHRGITIEGAVSVENVLELVDWAAKAGFNSYFTQFTTSYEFFSRWYEHIGNPFLPAEKIDGETAKSYIKVIVAALKKRSLLYHAVGHGWTPACLGLDCNGWSVSKEVLSEEKQRLIAQIDGKRKFFKGKPLNTHLCYSDPTARRLLAESVVEYAKTHPEVDVLHFWLADDFNNACECEECAKKRMSDWYVMILNEIDRLLTENGLNVKIVFLVYLELYWAPLEERILNPERFILMFAPIFRSYRKAFSVSPPQKERKELEYKRNKMVYPSTAEDYLVFLEEWKKMFKGDAFDFDYHLMWDINRDFGGETLAEVLYKDIHSLPQIGLNGLLSCQIQRAFYPNGFAFYLMGRALSDASASFEEIREDYYSSAFGEYGDFAKYFYKKIERTVSFAYMRDEADAATALPGFKEAKIFLTQTLKSFPEPDVKGSPVVTESMEILRFVAENVLRLLNVLILKIEGGSEEEIEAADSSRKEFFNRREMRFNTYADGFYVNMITDGIIACEKTGIYAPSGDGENG